MNHLNFKFSALILFIIIFNSSIFTDQAFSQSKISGTAFSEVIRTQAESPQVIEVLRNLKIARTAGDMAAKEYWESKLNELTHPQIIQESRSMLTGNKENISNADNGKSFNFTQLTNTPVSANAISRERVSGQIYSVLGINAGIFPDTLKVLRSTNNGITFTQIFSITSPGVFKITNNGIDVEAVSRGDSTYAFIGISYYYGTNFVSSVIRVRQDGGMLSEVLYNSSSVNKYTYARVTSDNAEYTTGAYVYFSTVLDSGTTPVRNIRSKLGIIKNPFAFGMILTSGYQDATNGSYSYLIPGAAPDSAKFETDIAFLESNTASDQLYTCTIIRGAGAFNGSSLYFTRSLDFGATAPAVFQTFDSPYLKETPRIAADGYFNNSLVVVTRRLFGGGDWDPYYFYTPDMTVASPVFGTGYVNSTADTTYGVSVAANYRSGSNTYLFAYNNLRVGVLGGNIYSRPMTGGLPGTNVQINPTAVIGTNYAGTPDATFRNVNNDSCMVIWSGQAGNSSYVTGGCGGTFTGIENPNSLIKDFRLDQNYPNPFNPTTNISYNIPTSGLVKIVVYDVLGSEVATVLNENKIAGYYSAVFDGKNLASGAYYYKITFISSDNNSFSQTKKMMLIK